MTVSASDLYFYVADEPDYRIALGAAAAAGVSKDHILTNFSDAYDRVYRGGVLVIAVGHFADSALYYNPCGWAGKRKGHTPFAHSHDPEGSIPDRYYFENGAGQNGDDTLKLVTMQAYYALHGRFPPHYGDARLLPRRLSPEKPCHPNMKENVNCPC